ncbi:MAG TPA: S8 family serine peptidase [Opitutaceae bacterium]|nr:S8 family serine peptidase [Opitutaceae bacterium]
MRIRYLAGLALALTAAVHVAAQNKMTGINVVLNTAPTAGVLAALGQHGKVRDVVPEISAVTLQARESQLAAIQALPFVAAAGFDQARDTSPMDGPEVSPLASGINTWNLDAVDVTNFGEGRTAAYDGTGVYVAVLDTGLLHTWRAYFPADQIATELARCFGGGGGEMGSVSSQPNKWERDQNSHGTHVTSSILGYWLRGTPINGAAPNAVVIPVKVLNQNGSGWSSVIARGIVYVANLKAGPLAGSPVVINMSLGGSVLDAVEKAAIDYAIEQGVIIVASAGNRGEAGMGYPGAYAPVISVAASGWVGEWLDGNRSWWNNRDVPEGPAGPDPEKFYITDFSSRQLDGQQLDVAAPGSWIVGPYQVNGQLNWFFLGGTSMASPHVAGIAALMLEKNPSLVQADVEAILKSTAVPLPAGTRMITNPNGTTEEIEWGENASGYGLVNTSAALAATP